MPSAKPKTRISIAALYVEPAGPYSNLEGVDVWDEAEMRESTPVRGQS